MDHCKQQQVPERASHSSSAQAGKQLLREFELNELKYLGGSNISIVFAAKLNPRALEAFKTRLAHVWYLPDKALQEFEQSSEGEVVLKLILDGERQTSSLKCFWQEHDSALKLRHPNIITIWFGFQAQVDNRKDQGKRSQVLIKLQNMANESHENLICILAMERLGPSLETIREKLHIEMFTKHEIVLVFKQIGSAIAHSHEEGVLHNDIKMDNIVTCCMDEQATREEVFSFPIKLIDFGIASSRNKVGDGNGLYRDSHHFGRMLMNMALPKSSQNASNEVFEKESSLAGSPGLIKIITMLAEGQICVKEALDLLDKEV